MNDLTVLILERDVTGKTVVPLVALNTLVNAPRPEVVRVVGYGATDDQGGGYGVRRMASIPIACYCEDSSGCSSKFDCDPGAEFIAGRMGRKSHTDDEGKKVPDTCKGDSGGGVFIFDARQGWMLMGITSRATPQNKLNNHLCGDGGIYVRLDLAKYRDWIMGVDGGHWTGVTERR